MKLFSEMVALLGLKDINELSILLNQVFDSFECNDDETQRDKDIMMKALDLQSEDELRKLVIELKTDFDVSYLIF